jgi:signal transduction histidine kinase
LLVGQHNSEVYRGADRRTRLEGAPPGTPATDLLLRAAVAAGIIAPACLLVLHGRNPVVISSVIELFAGLTAVATGGMLLVCWKIGGRAVPGRLGFALVGFGLLGLAYGRLAALDLGPTGVSEPYGRLIPCAIAATGIVLAMRSPEVDASLRPIRSLGPRVLVGLFLLAALELKLGATIGTGPWFVASTRLACASVWVAVALSGFLSLRRRATLAGGWVTMYALILAGSEVTGAVLATTSWGPTVATTGALAASALAVTAASRELRWTLRSQDRHYFRLRMVLDETRSELERERAGLEEQLHDLRNAVAGLRTADSTLRRYSGRLDEVTRAGLAEAISSELSRLQVLIEPGRLPARREFLLADALRPVVGTERTWGATIRAELGAFRVMGNPEALAQVVQNLLTNARLYAPGSPVDLRADRESSRVRLRVADRGPGIPPPDRDRIFERGIRGRNAEGRPGTGLGLFVAARLTAEMGGSLHLEDSADGACFVVEIPTAIPPRQPERTRRYLVPSSASCGKHVEKGLEPLGSGLQ